MFVCSLENQTMNQFDLYRSQYGKSSVHTFDFSQLEKRVRDRLLAHPNATKQFKNAVYYGTSIHQMVFDELSPTMPRRLFSFHPARNNQIVETSVKTLADLQEALDLNPDFIHISAVVEGKFWLIHKGPIKGNSATDHSRWKDISVKRLPKTLRTLLLISPL